MSHLFKSFNDISSLKYFQAQYQPYADIEFVVHGGSAFAHHTGNTRTKDFDVLVVGKGMTARLPSYWNAMMLPFFQHLKYEVIALAPSPEIPAIKNFAKKLGAIAGVTLRGPAPDLNVIDLGFIDTDLVSDESWYKTSTWAEPIAGSPLYVLTTTRLSANLAEKLANRQTPDVRNTAMARLGVLVPLIQRAVDAARHLESETDALKKVQKKIGEKLVGTPIRVSGWFKNWNGRGGPFVGPMKMYQLILTALALSSKTLQDHGVDMVLKGGTVSTQYIGALETDDIDVEVFRREPTVGFAPRPPLPANAPGKNTIKQNLENWGRYFGSDSMQYIIGFLVYLVRLLRTMDDAAIARLVEEAFRTVASDVAVTGVDYGLRAIRMSNKISLVSIDMVVNFVHGGAAMEESFPLFDCVFGDVHAIHTPTGIQEQPLANGVVKLKMQNSATIDADMIDMIEHKMYKREKRLLRFLKKKAAGNTISQNLRSHVHQASPGIRLLPVSLRRWEKIQKMFVPQTNRRALAWRLGVADLLRASETAGDVTANSNWNMNANVRNVNENTEMRNVANAMNASPTMQGLEHIIRAQRNRSRVPARRKR